MASEDKIKGTAKEAGGKVKEAVGSAVGNEKMEAEGKADQVEGKTQKNYGKAKEAVKDQTSGH